MKTGLVLTLAALVVISVAFGPRAGTAYAESPVTIDGTRGSPGQRWFDNIEVKGRISGERDMHLTWYKNDGEGEDPSAIASIVVEIPDPPIICQCES